MRFHPMVRTKRSTGTVSSLNISERRPVASLARKSNWKSLSEAITHPWARNRSWRSLA
jgi:hypothetical protein